MSTPRDLQVRPRRWALAVEEFPGASGLGRAELRKARPASTACMQPQVLVRSLDRGKPRARPNHSLRLKRTHVSMLEAL